MIVKKFDVEFPAEIFSPLSLNKWFKMVCYNICMFYIRDRTCIPFWKEGKRGQHIIGNVFFNVDVLLPTSKLEFCLNVAPERPRIQISNFGMCYFVLIKSKSGLKDYCGGITSKLRFKTFERKICRTLFYSNNAQSNPLHWVLQIWHQQRSYVPVSGTFYLVMSDVFVAESHSTHTLTLCALLHWIATHRQSGYKLRFH